MEAGKRAGVTRLSLGQSGLIRDGHTIPVLAAEVPYTRIPRRALQKAIPHLSTLGFTCVVLPVLTLLSP